MQLAQLKKDKALVSVSRELIDPNSIQGVILDYSDTLVLLQNVSDFILDGLMLVRRADITDIECTETDAFQKQLLVREGVFDHIDFNANYKLQTWKDFASNASKQHSYFIFEIEDFEESEFYIGKIEAIRDNAITFKQFNGIAEWDAETSVLEFDKITSCQISNNYLNVYERYFASPLSHSPV